MSNISIVPYGGDSNEIAARIAEIEKLIDVSIPDSFRYLLLKMNGGVVRIGEEAAVYPNADLDISLDYIASTEQLLEFYQGYFPVGSWEAIDPSFMPLGRGSSGDFVMGLYGKHRGQVYFLAEHYIPTEFGSLEVAIHQCDPVPMANHSSWIAKSVDDFFKLFVPLSSVE